MQEFGHGRELPQLKELVVEASRALAGLDANRLEELALSCHALNRDLPNDLAASTPPERTALARQAEAATGDMATFARVLDVTRANLHVMSRLRELRNGSLEYGEAQAQSGEAAWARTESRHGND